MQLVLVEGFSTKSNNNNITFTGRSEGNKRVIFPLANIFKDINNYNINGNNNNNNDDNNNSNNNNKEKLRQMMFGDITENINNNLYNSDYQYSNNNNELISLNELIGQYVIVRIIKSDNTTLKGVAIAQSSLSSFKNLSIQ